MHETAPFRAQSVENFSREGAQPPAPYQTSPPPTPRGLMQADAVISHTLQQDIDRLDTVTRQSTATRCHIRHMVTTVYICAKRKYTQRIAFVVSATCVYPYIGH